MKNNNQPALIKRMTSRLAAVLRLVAEQVGTRPLPQLRFSQTFAAFQHRNYRLWFAGQLISLVGTWMQTTAQGYLVFQLTRSPIYLGYVGFAAGVPSWLFMLYAAPVATQRVELTRRVAELVRQLGPAQLEELATVITRLETSLKESQWRN